MSKWNVYANNTLPDLEGYLKNTVNYWNDDEEMAFSTAMTGLFLEDRNEAIRKSGGNLVSLDILVIGIMNQLNNRPGCLLTLVLFAFRSQISTEGCWQQTRCVRNTEGR